MVTGCQAEVQREWVEECLNPDQNPCQTAGRGPLKRAADHKRMFPHPPPNVHEAGLSTICEESPTNDSQAGWIDRTAGAAARCAPMQTTPSEEIFK